MCESGPRRPTRSAGAIPSFRHAGVSRSCLTGQGWSAERHVPPIQVSRPIMKVPGGPLFGFAVVSCDG